MDHGTQAPGAASVSREVKRLDNKEETKSDKNKGTERCTGMEEGQN